MKNKIFFQLRFENIQILLIFYEFLMSKKIDLLTKMRMAFYYGQNDSQRLIAEKTGTSKLLLIVIYNFLIKAMFNRKLYQKHGNMQDITRLLSK